MQTTRVTQLEQQLSEQHDEALQQQQELQQQLDAATTSTELLRQEYADAESAATVETSALKLSLQAEASTLHQQRNKAELLNESLVRAETNSQAVKVHQEELEAQLLAHQASIDTYKEEYRLKIQRTQEKNNQEHQANLQKVRAECEQQYEVQLVRHQNAMKEQVNDELQALKHRERVLQEVRDTNDIIVTVTCFTTVIASLCL